MNGDKNNETNIVNEHNTKLKIPSGRRQTCWLLTNEAEDLT